MSPETRDELAKTLVTIAHHPRYERGDVIEYDRGEWTKPGRVLKGGWDETSVRHPDGTRASVPTLDLRCAAVSSWSSSDFEPLPDPLPEDVEEGP